MKKVFCYGVAIIFCMMNMGAEPRYVEIDAINGGPVIQVKSIDDFEAIVDTYDVKFIFLYGKESGRQYTNGRISKIITSTVCVAIANGTCFSFSIEGYRTLADYRAGTSSGYKTSEDYVESRKKGIESADLFYFYKENNFATLEDCRDAWQKGFAQADKQGWSANGTYYEARILGLKTYAEYEKYIGHIKQAREEEQERLVHQRLLRSIEEAISQVYWTKSDKHLHIFSDCKELKRYEELTIGTAQEAKEAGKTDICMTCVQRYEEMLRSGTLQELPPTGTDGE